MLDSKDVYILKIILRSSQYMTIDDITKAVGISQRSVYYSLDRINYFLFSKAMPKIENKRGIGLVIQGDYIEKIESLLTNDIQYFYSQDERISIEIAILLTNTNRVGVSTFENLFEVSKNTILKDLRRVKEELEKYNLYLVYNHGVGYLVEGDTFTKKSILIYHVSLVNHLLKFNTFGLYTLEDYQLILNKFRKLEAKLGVEFVQSTMETISKFITMLLSSNLKITLLPQKEKSKILDTVEYKTVTELFTEQSEDECVYITLHVLGLRTKFDEQYENIDDHSIKDLIEQMIEKFEAISLTTFEDKEEIRLSLYNHLKSAMYRYKYGIILDNILKSVIQENYPQIFNVTKIICKSLENQIGYPILEDEVAYLTMHFGGYLNRKRKSKDQVRLLLVCLNGIATSKLLRKELEYLIGITSVIESVTIKDVDTYIDEVDYVISTVPIKLGENSKKLITVNPVLTQLDKIKIVEVLGGLTNLNDIRTDNLINEIVDELNGFIPNSNINKVKEVLERKLNKRKDKSNKYEVEAKPVLAELITSERIQFVNKVETWQDAIKLSGKPLVEDGSIEENYIERVVSNVKELGPYIVIAPNVAIPHARPEDGVNKIAMSLLLLDEPVSFTDSSEKDARLLIMLAASDSEKHLLALQQLSELLMNSLDEIFTCKNKEQVIEIIKKYSK